MARDRDIINAVVRALEDTNLFDGVFPWALKDASDESADASRAIVISPVSGSIETRHGGAGSSSSDFATGGNWGGATNGQMIQHGQLCLRILCRDHDKQARDEAAGRLLEAAKDALNGTALIRYLGEGVIFPQWCKVQSWKWDEPQPPQREIEAVFQYVIDARDWNAFDATE